MTYGTAEHEHWLIEMERREDNDPLYTEHPSSPCGCVARAYGGDCKHTIDEQYELGALVCEWHAAELLPCKRCEENAATAAAELRYGVQ